ncbi:hypothetical protein [Candidatus Sororendozoicomonas aggregata]|uniref:hypothetical protein n=1 Tax=Candidatus Sororendozoicomonas aggregata TaxID=3073239 RepID=UPI002ED69336
MNDNTGVQISKLFPHIAFGDRSHFQRKKTGKVYTLVRKPVVKHYWYSASELEFYEGSTYAGSAEVIGELFQPVTKRPPEYTLLDIDLKKEFQHLSLGSLLVYIIITEARLNGSNYLYLDYPIYTALGFYLKLGFFPDPISVMEVEDHELSALSGSTVADTRKHYLEEKLKLSRPYKRWKCNIPELTITLGEAIHKKFKLPPATLT